jgi:drug/metabolite transporter (DMT)-like permease
MYLTHREIHKYELMGFVLAIVACIIMIIDPSAHRVGQKYSTNVSVDLSLIVSNIPAVIYFALNKSLMRNGIVPHLILMNFLTCVGFIVLTIVLEESHMTFSPKNGVFGWL